MFYGLAIGHYIHAQIVYSYTELYVAAAVLKDAIGLGTGQALIGIVIAEMWLVVVLRGERATQEVVA